MKICIKNGTLISMDINKPKIEHNMDILIENTKIKYIDKNIKTDKNTKIIEAGGVPFLNGVFTSTVNQDGKVYVFWFDRQKNAFSFKKWSKDNLSKYFVGRAFRKF